MIDLALTTALQTHIGNNFPEKNYLLAVSGGIDSMVLAHLFAAKKLTFSVVHCNFGLRGAASDADEDFVREFCQSRQIPFYSRSFNTEQYARRHHLSIQMAARNLRYDYFYQLQSEKNFDYIVTAHHADDQAETILSNLIRGTGISGLRGMPAVHHSIFRPLLTVSKKNIVAFAQQNNIQWREDQSNASTKYKRNAIRHLLLPEIIKLNPSFVENISGFTEKLSDTEIIYRNGITFHRNEFVRETEKGIIIDKQFTRLQAAKQFLYEWIKPFGFNFHQTQEMIQSINHTGSLFFSEKYTANIDRTHIIITRNEETAAPQTFDSAEDLNRSSFFDAQTIEKTAHTTISKSADTAFLDFELIQFPLTLRTWQPGDRFMPLGMKKYKKLSDFFIDRKVSRTEKKQIRVLLNADGKIIWVCGFRIDERFKISDKTKKILLLRFLNDLPH